MIQNVLSHIGGVGIYGVISLCIFLTVFIGALIWMLRLRKPYLDSMRELPLVNDSAPPNRPDHDQPEPRHE